MAGVLQHLRSSTLAKRPNPASMVDGQVAINYASGSPGMFFKDSNGSLVKVGPVHVGSGAPNAVPASGGTAGNSLGEQWLDTSGGTYVFKIWDGSAWRSEAGEFVNVTGDVMTGALGIIAGSAGSPGLYFSGDTDTGLFSAGANQLALATGGTGRLYVDASGNVLIGAASAVASSKLLVANVSGNTPLVIQGGVAESAALTFYNNAASTNRFIIGQGYSSGTDNVAFIQNNANAALAFGTNASERMRLDSSGRLGLGTSSPATNLDIRGTNSAQLRIGSTSGDLGNNTEIGTLEFFNSDANQNAIAAYVRATRGGGFGSGGYLTFGVSASGSSASAATEALRIDESGNVGIGTTAPAEKLDVFGVIRATNTTDSSFYGTFSNPDGLTRIRAYGGGSSICFDLGTSEKVRIDSSGRLLVGTSTARSNVQFGGGNTTPTVQVETAGDSRFGLSVINNSANGYAGAIRIGAARGTSVGSNTALVDTAGLGSLSFVGADGTNLIEGARIDAVVNGTPGTNDLPTALVFSTTADGASSPTERMRIASDGFTNLFVTANDGFQSRNSAAAGTTYGFFVGRHSAANTGDGTISYVVYTNGNVQNTNNSYGAISDIKLKENIVDANSQWNDLKALQVRNYNFKEGQTHTQIGLVAQEVELVSPGLVTESPDRDEEGNDLGTVTKSVNYSVLYMKAVKALQEAMERIETLEAKVATLEAA